MKIVASVCQEAKGDKYFTTTYMVKDDGPVKRVQDLKGGTIGVVGIKTATDLWARAGLLNAGLVPEQRHQSRADGLSGDRRRRTHRKSFTAGTYLEPFYLRRDGERRPAQALHGRRCRGLRPRAARYLLRREIPEAASRRGARSSSPTYVAITQWYLANMEQAKTDLHMAGFIRTPLPVYLKTADWKRDPNARGWMSRA